MKFAFALGCIGSVFVFAQGCGGGSSAPTSVDSGVDGSKEASAISSDEASKICTSVNNYKASKATMTEAQTCDFSVALTLKTLGAILDDTALKAMCSTAKDSCSKSSSGTGGTSSQPETDPCDSVTAVPGCGATVDELEACATASIDAWASWMKEIPAIDCETVTKASLADFDLGITQPTACTSLKSECAAVDLLATQYGIPTIPEDDGSNLGGQGNL